MPRSLLEGADGVVAHTESLTWDRPPRLRR